jgi:putative Ca2+/H+ antiporter (TMEM165/GDT1 family)
LLESLLVCLPVIALAELGDKTQLVTLYLSARYRKPLAVSMGVVCGAALNVGLAVLAGALLHRLVGEATLAWIVAIAFVTSGLWMLLSAPEGHDEAPATRGRGAFLTTLWLFFVLEMGDKTQLAVVGLAASLPSPTGVFVAATLGLAAANVPAVWLGHRYASRLPRALLNRIGGVVFVLVGAGLMIVRLSG